MDFDARAQQLIQDGFQVDIGGWIRRAWEVFQKEPGYFIGLVLVSQGLNLGAQLFATALPEFMGFVLTIGVAFTLLPLQLGYAILTRKILLGEEYSFGDVFGGYKMAGELIMIYVMYFVLVVLGMVLLVLPGVYLAIAFAWGPYFLFFFGKGAWDSLDLSRRIIHRQWWGMFGFFIVAGLLLNLAGALVCLVGLLVSIPVSSMSIYIAMHETFGLDERSDLED